VTRRHRSSIRMKSSNPIIDVFSTLRDRLLEGAGSIG
jgi:hypothetical protein